MNKVMLFIRKLLLAPFILYVYNLLANSLNLVIPINIVTILIVGILGIPGLIMLVLLLYIAF